MVHVFDRVQIWRQWRPLDAGDILAFEHFVHQRVGLVLIHLAVNTGIILHEQKIVAALHVATDRRYGTPRKHVSVALRVEERNRFAVTFLDLSAQLVKVFVVLGQEDLTLAERTDVAPDVRGQRRTRSHLVIDVILFISLAFLTTHQLEEVGRLTVEKLFIGEDDLLAVLFTLQPLLDERQTFFLVILRQSRLLQRTVGLCGEENRELVKK